MQKRGKTAKGTQRWLCIKCTTSHSLGHETQKQGRLLDHFVAWLLGKQSQAELGNGITDRTWRTQISWCWNIIPKSILLNDSESIVLLDGTIVGHLVCLIARNITHVLNWRWVAWESSHTWELLLNDIAPPVVVVCDGQKGILLAIARCWPETRIQRCLFHVWQNIRVKLTLHPQTEAGQELLIHFRAIWKINNLEHAHNWIIVFRNLYMKHENFLKQRTYLRNPEPNQRKWWYTHRSVRSTYRQLDKLIKDNQLFTYLDIELIKQVNQVIPKTTNYLEGGINSQLKHKLRLHRGLNQIHQQRLTDWFLYSKTKARKPPRNFL